MTRSRTHLALFIGTTDRPATVEEIAAPRRVALNFPGCSPEEIVSTIADAGLSVRDFRSNVMAFVPADIDSLLWAAVHCALSTLAGRAVPTRVGDETSDVEDMEERLRRERRVAPETIDPDLQVGGSSDDVPVVTIAGTATDVRAAINRIHFARRVTLAALASPIAMASMVSIVAAIRERNGHDRLPDVRRGDEVVNLGEIRKAAMVLRRQSPGSNADIAPAAEISDRLARIAEANSRDIEGTLRLLGTRQGPPEKNVWHCSRPERHTNGDRVPSMRQSNGMVRCMRCDDEQIGPVRLVADTLHMSAEDAADHILRNLPATD